MPAFVDRLAPNGRMVVAGMVAGPVPVDFGARLLNSFQLSRSFGTFSLDTVADDAKALVRAAQFEGATRGESTPSCTTSYRSSRPRKRTARWTTVACSVGSS